MVFTSVLASLLLASIIFCFIGSHYILVNLFISDAPNKPLMSTGLGFSCILVGSIIYHQLILTYAQRPYLINFDATGSPCHEVTSWDNSSSMSI
jgi:hypothetical protein